MLFSILLLIGLGLTACNAQYYDQKTVDVDLHLIALLAALDSGSRVFADFINQGDAKEFVQPLLMETLSWLYMSHPTTMDKQAKMDILEILYKDLHGCPSFRDALKKAYTLTIDMGLKYFRQFKLQIISKCKENKELIEALAKVATKRVTKHFLLNAGAKQAIKHGLAKVGTQGFKTAMKAINFAGTLFDLTQAGLEAIGYEKAGETIGLYGNIFTGAYVGFMVAGPPGATVGAATGTFSWIICEALETLSWLSPPAIMDKLATMNSQAKMDILQRLHRVLYSCKEAVKSTFLSTIDANLKYLERFKEQIIKKCKENKELIEALAKVAAKSVTKHCLLNPGAKQAIKYGLANVGIQGFKTAMKVTNPAGILVDLTQASLEVFGYENAGETIGFYGNVGSGALAGFMVAGPLGIPVGAFMGVCSWVIGEAWITHFLTD